MVRKWTEEDFKNILFERYGETYKLISKFKNYRTKVKIRHKLCGYEFEVTPASFLYSPINGNTKCPKCRRDNT